MDVFNSYFDFVEFTSFKIRLCLCSYFGFMFLFFGKCLQFLGSEWYDVFAQKLINARTIAVSECFVFVLFPLVTNISCGGEGQICQSLITERSTLGNLAAEKFRNSAFFSCFKDPKKALFGFIPARHFCQEDFTIFVSFKGECVQVLVFHNILLLLLERFNVILGRLFFVCPALHLYVNKL